MKKQYLLVFQFIFQEITIFNDYNESDSPNHFKITKCKYFGLVLDCTTRWDRHLSNINMRLCVNISHYQSILQ